MDEINESIWSGFGTSITVGNTVSPGTHYWYSTPVRKEFLVDESEDYWNVEIPVPGLDLEDINVKVKNSSVIVDISEGNFVSANTLQWEFEFKLKPKMIKSELKEGILTISIDKPKDSEFNVEIN